VVVGEAVTVAGIGSRRGVSAAEVIAAVAAARAACGRAPEALAVLAAKAGETGIVEAARRLGLPLLVADAAPEARLATRSAASLAAAGAGSASEAAALGAVGPAARLAGPRVAVGRVTCAFAWTEEAP
jgi:cobalt-precorrin 5A hydrolase